MIILPLTEDQVIDDTNHQNMFTSPYISHADLPGRNLMTVGQFVPAHLPDPSVGGENSSGVRNGFSTGLVKRFKRFTGAVLIAPKTTNPAQGNIGHSNRSAVLYQGVMTQLTQYTPNAAEYAASYLGVSPDGRTVVTAGV